MLLARASDELIRAQPGLEATCPGCDQPVLAKCGDVVIWHWAHRADGLEACDAWTEPETEWHLAWKEAALAHGCRIEVTMRDRGEWHRADIVRPDGVVIEVQHSSLGIGEALEREDFYRSHGGLAWIYDARERYWPNVQTMGDGVGDAAVCQWTQPSATIAALRAPLFFDTITGLLQLVNRREHWDSLLFEAWRVEPRVVFDPARADESGVEPPAIAASRLGAADAWTVLPQRCASCGAKPNGTFNDGSPRYRCHIDAPELHGPVAA